MAVNVLMKQEIYRTGST